MVLHRSLISVCNSSEKMNSDVCILFILFTSSDNCGRYIWSQCTLHLKTWPNSANCFEWALTEHIDQAILDGCHWQFHIGGISEHFIWQVDLVVHFIWKWPNCADHFKWALTEHKDQAILDQLSLTVSWGVGYILSVNIIWKFEHICCFMPCFIEVFSTKGQQVCCNGTQGIYAQLTWERGQSASRSAKFGAAVFMVTMLNGLGGRSANSLV